MLPFVRFPGYIPLILLIRRSQKEYFIGKQNVCSKDRLSQIYEFTRNGDGRILLQNPP